MTTSEELRSKAKEKRDLAREIESGTAGSATHLIVDAEHFEAAADEIDRLTAENERLKDHLHVFEEWKRSIENSGGRDGCAMAHEAMAATARFREEVKSLAAERDALRARVAELEAVYKAARRMWLFNRGYVSDGVEIPDDIADEAVEDEEAERAVSLFTAVKALEPPCK